MVQTAGWRHSQLQQQVCSARPCQAPAHSAAAAAAPSRGPLALLHTRVLGAALHALDCVLGRVLGLLNQGLILNDRGSEFEGLVCSSVAARWQLAAAGAGTMGT